LKFKENWSIVKIVLFNSM